MHRKALRSRHARNSSANQGGEGYGIGRGAGGAAHRRQRVAGRHRAKAGVGLNPRKEPLALAHLA